MGYVTAVNELYPYDKDIYDLMLYVFGPAKYTTGIYGTYNVFGDAFICTDTIAEQFIFMSKNRRLKKRVHHIIFGFDNVLDEATPSLGKKVGDTLIRLYPDYQAVYGLHEDKSFLHLHLVYGNAPINGGNFFLTRIINKYYIRDVAERIIDDHLNTIKMKMPKRFK